MMECPHGKTVIAESLIVRKCVTCNHDSVVVKNRELLVKALKSSDLSVSLLRLFYTLMDMAKRMPDGQNYFLVDNVDWIMVKNAKVLLPSLHVLDDPRLIYYDASRNRVFVFDLFAKDQRWDGLPLGNDPNQNADIQALARGLIAGRKLVMIPVKDMVPYRKGQIRLPSSPGFRLDKLENLADSLAHDTQTNPIVVRPFIDEKGKKVFEIIAGERRWRSAIGRGYEKLEAIVVPENTSDEQAVAIQFLENANREEVTYMDLAVAVKRYQNEFDWPLEMLRRLTGSKDVGKLSALMSLATLPESVIHFINDNIEDIPISQARVLLKFESEAVQMKMVKDYLERKEVLKENKQRRAQKAAAISSQPPPAQLFSPPPPRNNGIIVKNPQPVAPATPVLRPPSLPPPRPSVPSSAPSRPTAASGAVQGIGFQPPAPVWPLASPSSPPPQSPPLPEGRRVPRMIDSAPARAKTINGITAAEARFTGDLVRLGAALLNVRTLAPSLLAPDKRYMLKKIYGGDPEKGRNMIADICNSTTLLKSLLQVLDDILDKLSEDKNEEAD